MTTTKVHNYSLATTVMVLALCLSLSLSGVLVHTPVVKAADANAWKQLPMYDGGVSILAVDPVHSSTLYATTAGGLFRSKDSGATWAAINGRFSSVPDYFGIVSDFSNMTCFAINPKSPSTMFAGTSEGLFRTIDGGTTWTACGTIPAQTAQPGVESVAIDPLTPTTLYVATGYGVFRSANNGGTWKSMNTSLTKSGVKSLVINPKTPTTLYVIANYNGVLRSTDSGATWTAINTGLTGYDATSLAIDPRTPTILYTGSTASVANSQDRLFNSVDGGNTWKSLHFGRGNWTSSFCLAISPKAPATAYASTNDLGVFRSTDNGSTWSGINSGLTNRAVNSIAIDPKLSTTLYAGTNSGLFRSTNSGATWTKVNFPVAFTGGKSVGEMIVDPKTPTTMYQNCVNGVLYSHDSGMTWHTASSTSTIGSVSHIAIDPKTPSILYASVAKKIFRSTNSGATWTAEATLPCTDGVYCLIVDYITPTTLYAGTDAGIFRSTDSGANWMAANTGLTNMRVSSLTIDPVIHTTLYVGTSGYLYRSMDSGDHWTAMIVDSGDSGNETGSNRSPDTVVALAIDPANPSIMYAACDYSNWQTMLCRILRSTDRGNTWTSVIDNSDPLGSYLNAIVLDPATPTTVYAAGDIGVIRSTDSGDHWTETGLNQWVTSLVANPGTATLYACTWHGVFSYNMSSSRTLTTMTSPSVGGSVVRSPDAVSYIAGTTVTLTATPATGYSFTGWSGDLSGMKNPETITMDTDKTVTASFVMNAGSIMKLTLGSKMILVDGKQVPIDAAPDIFSSRTFIPIRIITEVFGGSIAWDAAEQKVTIVRNGTTLNLWIGKNAAEIDGKSVSIDTNPAVVPVISYGRTLLPLRFVAESFGLDVQWDGTAHTITVTPKS